MPEVVTDIPAHVPRNLVFDFDFANVPGAEENVHLAWKRLHEGPDIFWTPHYGGHWVATRAEDIEHIQKDHEHFSHKEFSLPRGVKPFRFAPLEYDPPEHADYRQVISPAFGPAVVAGLEKEARELAIRLIENLKPKGGCEFVSDFARHLPITVFLHMVDLPLSDREKFLEWAEIMVRSPSKEVKQKAFGETVAYLSRYIDERTAHPGKDLISRVVQAKVNGRPMERDEVLGMCTVLFFGGLDTVASMLSFVALFLARNPGHRRQLIDNPDIIPNAIEEFLRRHGLSNTTRVIAKDFDHKGIPFKQGELIQVPISLHGMDERRYENPLEVDFNRKPIHATFGNGPHRCPGSNLARTELRVFLQEWLSRIPDFQVKPGDKVRTQSGSVNGVVHLPLVWNT